MKVEVPKKKITWAGLINLFKLYKYIYPYRFTYLLGLLFLLGSSSAGLVFPKLVGDMVSVGSQGNVQQEINRIALLLLGVFVFQAIFSYFRIYLFVWVAEKTLADLRQNTYNHLIRLPMSFFLKRRVGELNSRVSADITLLQDALTTTLAEFLRQVITIFGGITILLFLSPKLTLFTLSVLPVVMVLVVVFGKYIRGLSKKAQNQVAESNTVVEETLQGVQSVKAFTNEFFEMDRYKVSIKKIAQTGIKNGRLRGAFSSFIILGVFGAMVAVIWRGAALVSLGELDIGELFSFVIYSLFIGGTIGGMASVFGRVQQFIGATEDLLEIFDEVIEPVEICGDDRSGVKLCGNIRLDGLSFEYPSRKDFTVLNNLNIKIEQNTTVALVGPSGAGKSTLATLLLRMYEPTGGQLLFDGIESTKISLTCLRNQMALVPQDIFLFGGTIKENIAYGKTEATDEEIIGAAKNANAWNFISAFKEGLDTLVGERGTQLSGGQRQRIAIARAMLKNPRILILDEATSSLDSESEKLVQEALVKLMKGRTSIVIAHRLSTIRKADNILVLNKGEIVEQGTHDQLMKVNDGLYKNLSDLQFA